MLYGMFNHIDGFTIKSHGLGNIFVYSCSFIIIVKAHSKVLSRILKKQGLNVNTNAIQIQLQKIY
ncbi:hypothetical protein BCR32DRAFT_289554 [Anaeromyces robustus]|uniref:Uncharacterized protein n=1 Tax=Anaeromyces robustus TaxID=1754192 RepID=A0A1Y1XN20_9FUNG|nr:hypothetical protein BCR32DRAFT_289554 [Anaeromyces robustus]|eukprot:ORX87157.1 hypothetical protein BCR32DRAFT_289554 [Anaeromyces robustus]